MLKSHPYGPGFSPHTLQQTLLCSNMCTATAWKEDISEQSDQKLADQNSFVNFIVNQLELDLLPTFIYSKFVDDCFLWLEKQPKNMAGEIKKRSSSLFTSHCSRVRNLAIENRKLQLTGCFGGKKRPI